jgi:hypothetical protein
MAEREPDKFFGLDDLGDPAQRHGEGLSFDPDQAPG